MRVLAIPASNSRHGINRQIIDYAAQLLEDGLVPDAEVEILDLNDYEMPIYSAERQEENGIPEPAARFYDKIGIGHLKYTSEFFCEQRSQIIRSDGG